MKARMWSHFAFFVETAESKKSISLRQLAWSMMYGLTSLRKKMPNSTPDIAIEADTSDGRR